MMSQNLSLKQNYSISPRSTYSMIKLIDKPLLSGSGLSLNLQNIHSS